MSIENRNESIRDGYIANNNRSIHVAFCIQHLFSLQRSNIYLSRFKCKNSQGFQACVLEQIEYFTREECELTRLDH